MHKKRILAFACALLAALLAVTAAGCKADTSEYEKKISDLEAENAAKSMPSPPSLATPVGCT